MKVIDFGQKSCESFRSYLDAYIDNELLVETTQKMLEHLDRCPECRRLLEERQRMKRLVRETVIAAPLPPGLETRIRQGVRQGHRAPALFPGWAAAVAALVVMLGSGYGIRTRWEAVRQSAAHILEVGLSDHVHCTLGGHYPDAPPSEDQMKKQLGEEYAGILPAVQQAAPEFVIREAHICSAEGRNYVHVILESSLESRRQSRLGNDSRLASVVIARKRAGEEFPQSLLLPTIRSAGLRMHAASMNQMEVAGFETNQHLVYFISNLSAADNKVIALKLAPGLSSALAKSES